MTRYPKLLPWFARKAGIATELAEKLWRRASCDAREIVGNNNSSAFYNLTMDSFFELLEGESRNDISAASPYSWIWRYQKRMAAHSFSATQRSYLWWENFWRNLHATKRLPEIKH